MAIDRKYGRVTLERGTIGPDEPVVVFRAQDALLVDLLVEYAALCAPVSPQHHLDGIAETRRLIVEWQAQHPTQVPRSAGTASEAT